MPGLRWTAPAAVNAPSIPRSVALSARDGLVWTASNGPHPGFSVLPACDSGTVAPLFSASAPSGATGSMQVVAASTSEALFALVQVPAPDALHRATLVTRWSATAAASGSPFAPMWTFDPLVRANGPARIGCDANGARVFCAAWDSSAGQARVDVIDTTSGASTANALLPAAAIDELSVCADGTRAAIAGGLDLWVVDGNSAVVGHRTLTASTSAIAMSGDGALIAVGGDAVHVLARRGQNYASAFDVAGLTHELARRVALSRDGSTLAVGWWNATTGVDLRFEVWDVATRTRTFQTTQLGFQNGLQNTPEVVRASADGARVAFACWATARPSPT